MKASKKVAIPNNLYGLEDNVILFSVEQILEE